MRYLPFNLIRYDRTIDSNKLSGGGLCIYVRNGIDYEVIDGPSLCNEHCEILWVKMSLPNTRPTFISNVYRRPDGDVSQLIDILDSNIIHLQSNGVCDVILQGDFNIDSSKLSPSRTKLNVFAENHLLSQLISSPTRVTNSGASIIDHAYVSNTDFYNNEKPCL